MSLIMVHAEGQEGSIEVDAKTGIVQTAIDQRPTWADGLTCALLAERLGYYFGNDKIAPRLDRDAHPQIANAGLIAFQDLGWIGVTPEGQQVEVEADSLYRQEVINKLLGIDEEGTQLNGLAYGEATIGSDEKRTDGEMETLTDMSKAGFKPLEAEQQATGTK